MSVQMDTTNAQDSSDEFSSDSEYANLSGEEWQKVANGGTKRKKDARRTATPRKRVVQKTTPPSSPSSHPPANSPAEFSPKVLVINAPQWKGEFPVMIALSTEYPALKILTKRGLTRTLIRAKDQASQDSLLNITSLQQKPVSFTPLPDTKATRYGIVQRVPLAVPTALLRATTPLVLEADRMSVWNSTAKAAQPTMSIKIKYEGNLPASLEIGHLGSFSVRPFTPDPIRCYRCQRFGHTTRTCHQETSTCGICSGAHRTTVCQQKRKTETVTPQCSNCKGKHSTASKACPVRKLRAQALAPKLSSTKKTPAATKQTKPSSKDFRPTMADFPKAQQAHYPEQLISVPPAKAPTVPTTAVATTQHSYAGATSRNSAHKQNTQAAKPTRQQKATSTPAVPGTPINNKPTLVASKPSSCSTPKVSATTQEETETAETCNQLLEMLFAQLDQLRPLLAVRQKATRNIVAKMLSSTQALLGEIIAVM